MDKFSLVGVFIMMVYTLATVSAITTSSCICKVQHPQSSFCSSDFVFVATINESTLVGDKFIYKMRVSTDRVFKGGELIIEGDEGDEGDEAAERYIDVYTPYGSLCGRTELTDGKEYLITGTMVNGHIETSYCNWVEKWTDLSTRQKEYLQMGRYANQCGDCVISGVVSAIKVDHNALSSTFHSSQLSGLWTRFHCSYNPVSSVHYNADGGDCEEEHAYCSRDAAGTCMWRSNAEYKSCFHTREAKWALRDPKAAAFTNIRQCTALPTRRLKRKCVRHVRKHRQAQRAARNQNNAAARSSSRQST